jgi:hypothetical protein
MSFARGGRLASFPRNVDHNGCTFDSTNSATPNRGALRRQANILFEHCPKLSDPA